MQQRVSFITLGVSNLAQSRSFYEQGLGWKPSKRGSSAGVVFFQMNGGVVLALFPQEELAQDAGLPNDGAGFRGFALAYNVHQRHEVAQVLELAKQAGGTIVKPAQDTSWGGHSGYFADPDGILWEVAWNPHFELTFDGQMNLPE
ncbi:VOC family protein [Vampirovibrio sp.]|uniref:VOC family protein n=1 Tax=Vampirovibrio sp. TaxID=2717857 RepID=UPI0035938A36